MKRTLLLFLPWTIFCWLAEILAIILTVPAVYTADKTGRLRPWLRWMETPDDLGWRAGYYEPAIKAIYDKHGEKIALVVWLLRNRVYGLGSQWRCSPSYDTMTLRCWGTPGVFSNAPAWWFGTVQYGDKWFFEFSFAVRFGNLFNLGMRSGWKLLPFFTGHRPENFATTATGIFAGITLRSSGVHDS